MNVNGNNSLSPLDKANILDARDGKQGDGIISASIWNHASETLGYGAFCGQSGMPFDEALGIITKHDAKLAEDLKNIPEPPKPRAVEQEEIIISEELPEMPEQDSSKTLLDTIREVLYPTPKVVGKPVGPIIEEVGNNRVND